MRARVAVLCAALAAAACGDDGDSYGDDGLDPDAAVEADADTGEPDADTPPAATCTDYCTTVTSNCTGTLAQYTSMQECLSYCDGIGWELGVADDVETGKNSVGCRQYHAGAAAQDAATHCPHAGPSGGNVCGTWCTVYCDNLETNCVGDDAQYADRTACEAACAGLPTTGAANDTAGDTVQCRIYHGGIPAAGNPGTHCPHAGEDGAGVCI